MTIVAAQQGNEAFVEAIDQGDAAKVKSMPARDRTLADGRTPKGYSVVMWALFSRKGAPEFQAPQKNAVLQALLAHKPKLGPYETAALGTAADLEALLARGLARTSSD